ncbi:hypothetical protein CBS101457_006171 [Exobasidium rhododendri]|nr:hypothetical protein CBS101457_006171 [Exobasidium rhododendri]
MVEGKSMSTQSHSIGYPIYATTSKEQVASLLFTPPDKLELLSEPTSGTGASWITFDKKKGYAYVLGEGANVYELGGGGKTVRISQVETSTRGIEPVASSIVHGCLFVANYGSGSASILEISPKDHLLSSPPAQVIQYTRKGVGPVIERQGQSYAHDVSVSPDEGWVYICDLGSDEIHHIRVNKKQCSKSTAEKESTPVALGSGPRHLSFYKDHSTGQQFAYLASELATTLTAFAHDPQTGKLHQIGSPLLTVPKGMPLGGSLTVGPQRTTAEVAVSPDGDYVYVSNRGDEKEDHITIFARRSDGSIDYKEWVLSGGLMPRHFSMSVDGKYLAVAHQNSSNVVILKRDVASGSLSKTGAVFSDLDGTAFAGFYPPQPYV